MSGRRGAALVVAVVLAAASLAGCQQTRVGGRCKGSGFGQSGNFVTLCRNGRWARSATKAQVAAFMARLIAARAKPPVGEVVRPRSLGSPNVLDTADPFVLTDGGTHYLYATSNFRRVPVRTIADIDASQGEMYEQTTDAMPAAVPWASRQEVWAPAVGKFGGEYVMFFTARRANPPDPSNGQCVGRATSSSPTGPFTPEPSPTYCGIDGVRGSLDPSVFRAPDGRTFLLVAMGGSATNLWTMPLDGAGRIAGAATALLTREQPWEDWFLENPAMWFDGSSYLLAYSAGRWDSAGYTTGIARCASPTGPCSARPDGPWLSSLGERVGPGGLEFFSGADGQARVVFHTYPANNVTPVGARSTHVQKVAFDPWPRFL